MKISPMKKVFIGTLLVVIIFSSIQLFSTLIEYKQGGDVYEAANKEYVKEEIVTPAPLAPPLVVDWASLKALNPDVSGWIYIKDSMINYPLVQGSDNQKYLNYSYDGSWNRLGSLFIDHRTADDFEVPHTIIYGHNMLTEDMFGTLERYKDPAYFEKHRDIFVMLDGTTKKYLVFSAYKTDAYGDTYTIAFKDTNEFGVYLSKMKGQSLYDTKIPVSGKDQIITLSTCASSNNKNERFVVQAKEVYE